MDTAVAASARTAISPAANPTTLPPGSDEVLARLVASRAGERAFRAIYERHHLPLYRYCHSIVGNEADAQDALQSTFTKAFVALREGRRKAPLRPWLYRIAHNESVSLLRSRRATIPQADIASTHEYAPSAEERASERARLRLLLSDLSELAERARAALVMRELGGLSHEEIATALEVSVGAAKQAIFEARSALLELEQGRAMPCEEVTRRLSDADRRTLRRRKLRAHLRDCPSCAAFAAGITARQEQLRALTPALSAVAAGAVLTRALQGSGITGGVGAAASGGSTVAGAIKVAAAGATPKALLATAVVAGVAAGAGGLVTGSIAGHASHGARAGSARPLGTVLDQRSTAGSAPTAPQALRSAHARPTAPKAPTHKPGTAPPAKHGPPSSPGKSSNSASRTGQPPGLVKHNHTPPGQLPHNHAPPGQAPKTHVPPGLSRHDHIPPGQTKPTV